MSHEIELKLALGQNGPAALGQHPRLAGCRADTQHLTNTYYDTPEGTLEAARMALRLRQQGKTLTQTLKTEGDSIGGLSRRGEWEWEVPGPGLDREGLAALPPMAALGTPVLEWLVARFTTDFERCAWLLSDAEATIEVALDLGEIRTDQQRVPIRELELELKSGDPRALWRLAAELAERVALRPSDTSKAARGGALLTGHWSLPEASQPLHRAIVALDALADTGDDSWRRAAIDALQPLVARGNPHAAVLDKRLASAEWLTPAFGQAALALARDAANGAAGSEA